MNAEEQKIRAQIAYDIRADLVCCDMYDKVQEYAKEKGYPDYLELEAIPGYHGICHWAEAAARIAVDPIAKALKNGLCGNRFNHEPHVHESASLGTFWCTAEQPARIPYAAELRRISNG